ncbi:MAG: hypothetical protein ACFFDC_19640 [Promethearchaeota archaeon]
MGKPEREVLSEFLNLVNSQTFFKEFSFAKNCFIPKGGTEIEFSDYVLYLDRYLIIFQLKERCIKSDSTQTELNWLENRIRRNATKQIRKSLEYLNKLDAVLVKNERNNLINIKSANLKEIHKVVIYLYPGKKPSEFEPVKFHTSKTAGFIHIIDFFSYQQICEILYTPIEIIRYLKFRETILSLVSDANEKTEKYLLGRYLLSPIVPSPELDSKKEDYSVFVDKLQTEVGDYDMRFVFNSLKDRIYKIDKRDELSYYKIISELALLDRAELKLFKKRFDISLKNSIENKFDIFRMISENTKCGFVFISIPRSAVDKRFRLLEIVINIAKYEMKLEKLIGAAIVKENGFFIDWGYINYPWEHNAEVENQLKQFNPFKPLKGKVVSIYEFINSD